jgi:hypothetical protein
MLHCIENLSPYQFARDRFEATEVPYHRFVRWAFRRNPSGNTETDWLTEAIQCLRHRYSSLQILSAQCGRKPLFPQACVLAAFNGAIQAIS